MNIQNALKISGWMREAELQWLAEQASTRRLVCEVGSWMGRSTRAIADNLPEGGVVYAVDTWKGTPGPNECAALLQGKSEAWLFEQFARNIWPLSNVNALQRPSTEAAVYLRGRRFDMIFLDAAHDYDNVKADILAWQPCLAPGGLLCGHDFGGIFPGVQHAVLELIPGAKKVGAGSIWSAPIL